MDLRINVTRPSMPPFEEYCEEIRSLWDSRWLTNMGENHNRLEEELEKYLSVDNISLTVNGHLALELALQALDLKGEIITTPFTFVSTTHAIIRSGCVPVFCDINTDDFTIDVTKIEELITEKTCAIMPVHVYGNICDIEAIQRIAEKYGLKVIYDAAHAFGEEYKGRGVLGYGDMSTLSFHATKVFHTIEGGAICYKNPEYRNTINRLRNFGIADELCVEDIGLNAKMNEFSAIMGLCNLRYISVEIEKRKNVDAYYREVLGDLPGIKLRSIKPEIKSNYSFFPILVDEEKCGYTRDELCARLKDNNIYARKYFYPLTCDYNCFDNVLSSNNHVPVARNISNIILTLPIYGDMTKQDINRVCSVIK